MICMHISAFLYLPSFLFSVDIASCKSPLVITLDYSQQSSPPGKGLQTSVGFGEDKWVTMQSQRRRQWHPTPVLLPGKSHGWRSLEGCSPWGCWGSDTTERLHFHFSLSCIEGNGNPLQYSCLENPRDGGAWWAAIYGVAQSQTWLKWLSSSSMQSQTLKGSSTLVRLYSRHSLNSASDLNPRI